VLVRWEIQVKQLLYQRSRVQKLLVLLSLAALVTGCARHYSQEASTDPYGFFSGIWHGLLFPYSLLVNILSWLLSIFGINFLASVEIVGRPNTGFFFYYIGFILGLCPYGAGGSR
jgi:hypothetical protein